MEDLVNTSDTPTAEEMLDTIEARVLGALMEKQLTTPDAYPLTLNSLALACNQKTSREPVTNYENGALQRCLSALQDRSLVEADYSGRAQRYGQRLTRVLSVDKATQAILTVLLLRGPQTAAEILNRTQRMFDFSRSETLEEKLAQLCAKTTPYVIHIPKQAGQREDRYMHLLCGAPDLAAIAAMQSQAKVSSSHEDTKHLEHTIEQQSGQIQQLETRLALLEKQMAVLMDVNGISNEDLNT
jgi:uncharacterized protein